MINIIRGQFELLGTPSYTNDDILSLAEIKDILKIEATTTSHDNILKLHRDAGINMVYDIIQSYIINTNVRLNLYFVNNLQYSSNIIHYSYYNQCNEVIIDKQFVNSVDEIRYLDNDVFVVLDNSKYQLNKKKRQSRIYLSESICIKQTNKQRIIGDTQIDFQMGVAQDSASIPVVIKSAILEYIQVKFEGCGNDMAISTLKNNLHNYKVDFISGDWYARF